MEGDSVTLHTNLTHIQTDEQILWLFGLQGTRIAEIYHQKPKTYDTTGRYGGRLRINSQTGSLTITNITSTDSGLHELQIINSRGTVFKRFNVSVYDNLTVPITNQTQHLNTTHDFKTFPAAAVVLVVFFVIVVAVKLSQSLNNQGKNRPNMDEVLPLAALKICEDRCLMSLRMLNTSGSDTINQSDTSSTELN
ncbi:T-lymphocyte surface antigen Ly-9-like isoform X2 [Triplophysa dalaica]|uniref:T-lymphocyte surface antigen Ly-9-like isoform X2 n=1 Tax=Triplophysa dalaica TaxID=1582913 RepID=UPI0024DF7756|nr:T-lymphocyte surface antigen Ly-9-like isoform X2 [Triplophysa dalaica]